MSSNARQRAHEIFTELVGLSEGERGVALEGACGSDAAIRAEVEALLRSHDGAGRFIASPTADEAPTIPATHPATGPEPVVSPLRESAGTRIGPYKLLQQIGEGGFGSVFMAEQEEPVRRKVALKIIKLGMDTRQGRRPLRAAAAGARAPLKLVWIRSNLFELVDAVELLWETRP